ncbi:alpha/beta hydrolase [Agrobacterium rhizogenes]|nr:alpha/beta hydrolase [Rhizobium rhizogenes]
MSGQEKRLLNFQEWGKGVDLCVLIHGFGDGAYIWNDFAGRINGCRIIGVDLRGHGNSDWSASGYYSVREHAADVVRLIANFDYRQLLLVGHSLGGRIASEIASCNVLRLSALAIVDYGPDCNLEARAMILKKFADQNRIYSCIDEYRTELQAYRPFANPALLDKLAIEALRLREDGKYALKRDPALSNPANTRQIDSEGEWAVLSKIKCPVVVVRGAGSAMLSPVVAAQIASRPQRSVITIDRAGHDVMIDNPELFAEAMKQFISELFRS